MEVLRQQFIQALGGGLDVLGALAKRDREAAQHGIGRVGEHNPAVPVAPAAPPLIRWHDASTPDRRLVEVANDRVGLLAILTAVFERAGVDIDWAKITTLGASPTSSPSRRWPPMRPAMRWNAICTRCCPPPPAPPVVEGQLSRPGR